MRDVVEEDALAVAVVRRLAAQRESVRSAVVGDRLLPLDGQRSGTDRLKAPCKLPSLRTAGTILDARLLAPGGRVDQPRVALDSARHESRDQNGNEGEAQHRDRSTLDGHGCDKSCSTVINVPRPKSECPE